MHINFKVATKAFLGSSQCEDYFDPKILKKNKKKRKLERAVAFKTTDFR